MGDRELRAAALGGIVAVVAILLGAAALGVPGRAAANQTLLANLSFHAALTCLLAVPLLAWARWRFLAAGIVVAVAAIASVQLAKVRWTVVAPVPEAAARLELLHVNVLGYNPRSAEMARVIAQSGADVAVVLEADGVRAHLPMLTAVYPYRFGCDDGHCEVMILSKLPLRDARWAPLTFGPRRLATAVVERNGHPIRLVAAHFSKDFFTNLREIQRAEVREAVGRRALGGRPDMVLTGDFNAVPWDPVARRVARDLDLRHPSAWLPTWPVAAGLAGFPIDHLLVSGRMRVERIGRLAAPGSNHVALRATVALAP